MRIPGRSWLGWAAIVALGWLAGPLPSARGDDKKAAPAPTAAAPKKSAAPGPKGKKVPPVNVAALTERLKSSDSAEVTAGLAEAKSAGKGALAVAPVIEDLLRRGTQADLVGPAFLALAEMGSETSTTVIAPYARHRNPETRRKALAALARTGGAPAVATLRGALSDADPGVRGVAASGLGALHGREAIGDLFLALDHDIAEAAASIGQLCAGSDCDKLIAKLDNFGFDVMTSGFEPILFRPASDVPDETKLRIVEKVRDLRTGEANKYLRDLQSRWPASESARVRQAIEQAVLATAGSKS